MSDGQSKPTLVSSDLDIIINSGIRRRYSVVQVDRSSGFLVVSLKKLDLTPFACVARELPCAQIQSLGISADARFLSTS